jgi:hypothetical protein
MQLAGRDPKQTCMLNYCAHGGLTAMTRRFLYALRDTIKACAKTVGWSDISITARLFFVTSAHEGILDIFE